MRKVRELKVMLTFFVGAQGCGGTGGPAGEADGRAGGRRHQDVGGSHRGAQGERAGRGGHDRVPLHGHGPRLRQGGLQVRAST